MIFFVLMSLEKISLLEKLASFVVARGISPKHLVSSSASLERPASQSSCTLGNELFLITRLALIELFIFSSR